MAHAATECLVYQALSVRKKTLVRLLLTLTLILTLTINCNIITEFFVYVEVVGSRCARGKCPGDVCADAAAESLLAHIHMKLVVGGGCAVSCVYCYPTNRKCIAH